MSTRTVIWLNHFLLPKASKVCVNCYYSVFNFLFYLPCGGETFFRRRCVKFASLTAGDLILDVCCGAGELTTVIARQGFPAKVIGLDISGSALEIARKRTQCIPVTFVRASADDLPFDSFRFNKCFVSFGLHHMAEQERWRALKEIHRILAPEGTLYVIDYNLPRKGVRRLAAMVFAKLDESDEAYKMLKTGSLFSEIDQVGFEIARRGLTCQGIIQLLEAVKR